MCGQGMGAIQFLGEKREEKSDSTRAHARTCVCVMVLYACQVDVSRAILVTVIAVFGKGVELRD